MPKDQIAQFVLYGLLGAALAISTGTDLWRQLIYNWVTFPTMVVALAARGVGGGWGPWMRGWGLTSGNVSLASGLVGLAVGFGVFLVPYLFGGGVKEGDVKLAGAVGAVVGFPAVLPCIFFITLVGGLEAVLVLAWKGKFWRTMGNVAGLLGHRLRLVKTRPTLEGDLVPYGVAIAVGSAWGVAWTLATPAPW